MRVEMHRNLNGMEEGGGRRIRLEVESVDGATTRSVPGYLNR